MITETADNMYMEVSASFDGQSLTIELRRLVAEPLPTERFSRIILSNQTQGIEDTILISQPTIQNSKAQNSQLVYETTVFAIEAKQIASLPSITITAEFPQMDGDAIEIHLSLLSEMM